MAAESKMQSDEEVREDYFNGNHSGLLSIRGPPITMSLIFGQPLGQ